MGGDHDILLSTILHMTFELVCEKRGSRHNAQTENMVTPDLIRPLMVVGGLSRRGTGPGTYAGDGRREGGSYFSRDP